MTGYTKIPNYLLDNMADLTPAQFKLVIAMHRITIGWQKDSTEISISGLSKLTGLSRRGVKLSLSGIEHIFQYKNGVVLSTRGGTQYHKGGTQYHKGGTQYHKGGTQLPNLHLSKEKKEKKEKKETADPILDLVNHFADTAKVERPNGKVDRRKWLDPLISIYHAAHDDYNQTCRLITDTVLFLRERGYTVVTPKSILNTATTAEMVQQSRGVSDV